MSDLAASGLTPEQAALLMELSAAVAAEARPIVDESATRRRAKDREYQAERRRQNRQISADSADPLSLEASPQTPQPKPIPQPPLKGPPPKAKKGIDLPDWLPAEPWAAFVKMRKAMRSVPFTDEAAKGIIGDLDRLRIEGHDPEKLLLKAVKRGWRGVFEAEDTRAASPKLSPVETADRFDDQAKFFEKIGKPDDAEECRRRAARLRESTGPPGQPIGRAAARVVQQASGIGS